MKKLLSILFLSASVMFGAANDLILTQRKPDNSGNIQRNVPTEGAISDTLASLISAIGLGTEDSPQFTGITLVGSLAAPTTPTVTPQGTSGATAYSYKVVALMPDGRMTNISSAGSTATGNATLNGVNFNRITWSAYTGADRYFVYRTASAGTPSNTGIISSAEVTGTTFDDTGINRTQDIPIPSAASVGSLEVDLIHVGAVSDASEDFESRFAMVGDMSVNGAIRASNQDNFTKGAGVELQYVPGVGAAGFIHAYDRDGDQYKPIILNHGSSTPADAQVAIGTSSLDTTHMLQVNGTIYGKGMDLDGAIVISKPGGGLAITMSSGNGTTTYGSFGNNTGNVGFWGAADQVYGGSSSDAAFAVNGNHNVVIAVDGSAKLTTSASGTTLAGTITTAAGKAWNLGESNVVSPTAPNRTITIVIDGTTYYLAAKTTND